MGRDTLRLIFFVYFFSLGGIRGEEDGVAEKVREDDIHAEVRATNSTGQNINHFHMKKKGGGGALKMWIFGPALPCFVLYFYTITAECDIRVPLGQNTFTQLQQYLM